MRRNNSSEEDEEGNIGEAADHDSGFELARKDLSWKVSDDNTITANHAAIGGKAGTQSNNPRNNNMRQGGNMNDSIAARQNMMPS